MAVHGRHESHTIHDRHESHMIHGGFSASFRYERKGHHDLIRSMMELQLPDKIKGRTITDLIRSNDGISATFGCQRKDRHESHTIHRGISSSFCQLFHIYRRAIRDHASTSLFIRYFKRFCDCQEFLPSKSQDDGTSDDTSISGAVLQQLL